MKIYYISHRRGLKRFCNHALRYYVTKVEWTRKEESLCYGRACCCSPLILLSNLVFYCFKGAKYRTTLLPPFFPVLYIFALLSRGCFWVKSSLSQYVLATVHSPWDIFLCTSSERSSNPFLPQWRIIFPNLFSCLICYHDVFWMLHFCISV